MLTQIEIIDLDSQIDPETLSLCPLCDSAVLEDDFVVLISSNGGLGLAHFACVKDIQSDSA